MHLVVYLVHWNAPNLAADSVRSLFDSQGLDVELVVIDNASAAADVDRLERTLGDDARVLRLDTNRGFAGAANVALADARERNLAWFGVAAHDVIVQPDCLRRLVAAMDASPEYGILGPGFWDEGWSAPVSTGGVWAHGRVAHRTTWEGDPPPALLDADWLQGALLLIRLDCAESVRGFRDELFAYCEDVDFCLRAHDEGWRVGVVPSARAQERGHRVESPRRVYLIRRNALLIGRERLSAARFVPLATRAVASAARSLSAAVIPWRDKSRRSRSWQNARAETRALLDAVGRRSGPGGLS